jgi:iron complex outermembrane receptor protein
MMAGGGYHILLCTLAICLAAGNASFARGLDGSAGTGAPEMPGPEEPKPKADEPKADDPKGEEPKADDPKGEEPKAEEKKKDDKVEKAQDRGMTESVTVTATRVETDLMKTPVAVSAFDQETLDREGVKDLEDMANLVPNMDIAIKNGQSTPIISMRGVRSTNETELGDPSVGVHLDGIYSPRMQGILALMFDNERVEVLRGPQGTLFGRNSTVGSVNIVTAKPKIGKFDSNLSFSYGNYNAPEVSGMVNVPVSDTFALRFSGRYLQRDSYIDGYWDPNQYDQRRIGGLVEDAEVIAPGSFAPDGSRLCTGPLCYTRTQHSNWWIDEVNGSTEVRALVPADDSDFYMNAKEWAYRISGLWQPSDDLSLNVSFQQYRSDSAGGLDLVNCEKLRGRPNYEAVFDEDPESPSFEEVIGYVQVGTNDCGDMFPEDDTYQAVVNTPGQFELDINYLRSQLQWDINDDLRLVYLAGFENQDRESAVDMEQSLNAWDQAMFFLPGTGSQSWMNEVQLQSYGNKRLNWIAGVNYFTESTETTGYFDNALGERSLWDQPDRSTNASALFAQGTLALSPEWYLSLGYRYSDETKEDKGGTTYTCSAGGCAPNDRDREGLNELPVDYFENTDIYTSNSANDNKGSWQHSDWRIGLDFDKDNTLLYTYLATGFKAGGIGDVFNETNPRTGEEINVRTTFEPEEVVTLEVGFKQRFPRSKLDLRGAYFHTDYDDMQYASVGAIAFTERYQALRDQFGNLIRHPDCPPDVPPRPDGAICFGFVTAPIVAYFTQNVPGAEIQGFELEYDWKPWRGGRIHGYAAWLDTEITEDWITKWDYDPVSYFGLSYEQSVDPNTEELEVNLKGNELAVSPPFSVHMTVDHAFYLSSIDMAIVPWVTMHWEDDAYLTIWNVEKHTEDLDFVIFDEDIRYTDDKRDAWSMYHAGVRFYAGPWTAEVYGYNLTDEVVQWWGGAAEQVAKGSFSTPRTYGIRVGYQF